MFASRTGLPFGAWYVIVLSVTVVALVKSSGEDRIWEQAIPGYRLIFLGYLMVAAINVAVWLFGYREFNKEGAISFRPLLAASAIAYVPLALVGVLIGQEYNSINAYYLDKRRPAAYFAADPEAIQEIKRHLTDSTADVGPDLRSLLYDPSFREALHKERFYKQNFDEAFQKRAVMFGYNAAAGSLPGARRRFTTIRIPNRIATALRFQNID